MKRTNWSRDELILAFNLYCKTPFGRIHIRNPEIIVLADILNRTPSAVSWKLANFARLDPSLKKRAIQGATHGGKGEIDIWNEFSQDWESLSFESERLLAKMTGKSIEQIAHIDESELPKQGKEREAIVRIRVNQSFFRNTVLAAYNFCCCITGLPVPELLNAMRFPIGSYRVSSNFTRVDIFDKLGLQIGCVQENGAIVNRFGLVIGSIDGNAVLHNQAGMNTGPMILQQRDPIINSIGIGKYGSNQTPGEALLTLLGGLPDIQGMPAQPNYQPPIYSPAPILPRSREPQSPPAPLPHDQNYPIQFARLESFAKSVDGLNYSDHGAKEFAIQTIDRMIRQNINGREMFPYISQIIARFLGLRGFAEEHLKMPGADARVWANRQWSGKMSIKLLEHYYSAFFELANSRSGFNLSSEDAREWALNEALRWTPGTLPDEYESSTIAGRIYDNILNIHKKMLENAMASLRVTFQIEYCQAHDSKWKGGLGLPDQESRNHARQKVEGKFRDLFTDSSLNDSGHRTSEP